MRHRCIMSPIIKEQVMKSNKLKEEYIPLQAGDVLAYHGNLSYYLNCRNEGSNFLFLHLVEGRGVKWEQDN